MAKQNQCVVIFISVILLSQASALTDQRDVAALEDCYLALNQPPQLRGWKLHGGDPCAEGWLGISCAAGSSVTSLNLRGLNLSGNLSPQLYNLFNLKTMDVSSNYIGGEIIPYTLPPNASYMNLSHNLFSGHVGNVYTGLENLRQLDLSYNLFTGDIPSSFGSSTNLTGLYTNFPIVSLSSVVENRKGSMNFHQLSLTVFLEIAAGLGLVLYLAGKLPTKRKLLKSEDKNGSHQFKQPRIEHSAPSFSTPKFESSHYQMMKDGKCLEAVNRKSLVTKKVSPPKVKEICCVHSMAEEQEDEAE